MGNERLINGKHACPWRIFLDLSFWPPREMVSKIINWILRHPCLGGLKSRKYDILLGCLWMLEGYGFCCVCVWIIVCEGANKPVDTSLSSLERFWRAENTTWSGASLGRMWRHRSYDVIRLSPFAKWTVGRFRMTVVTKFLIANLWKPQQWLPMVQDWTSDIIRDILQILTGE